MRGFLESLRAELKSAPLRLVNLYPSGIRSEFWENSDHVDSSGFMTPEDAAAYMLDALAARSSCHVTDLFIGRNAGRSAVNRPRRQMTKGKSAPFGALFDDAQC